MAEWWLTTYERRLRRERDEARRALREARRQVEDARSFSYRAHRDRAEKAEAERDALAEALRKIAKHGDYGSGVAQAALVDTLGEDE